MKTDLSTKLTLSVCALVGGVFITSASARPFKLFSHDRDRDRDREAEADAVPEVYIVTDDTIQPGSTGIVRVIPKATAVIEPAPEQRPVLKPEPKSRKTKSGETRFLEPTVVREETATGETPVPRKAQSTEETRERVMPAEESQAPAKPSRSSSKKEVVTTTRKRAPQPARDEEAEVKTQVTSTRHMDREDLPPTKVHEVEQSESIPVVRSNNPLVPNPAATEERKPLVPSEIPAPPQETTVTKEVTTSNTSPAVQEAPPEQHIEKEVNPSPTPEVPNLTAPSDYASTSRSSTEIAPANLPPGTIDKAGAKRPIPTAKKTEKPGFVMTPFTPSKLIDVRGMASGSLAKDPSTSQVFRVP